MEPITYQDLVNRYGTTQAFGLLLTVERLAKINYDLSPFDENTRFKNALEALNNINFAAV